VTERRAHKAKSARPRSSGRAARTQRPLRTSGFPAGEFPIVGLGASAGGLDACKKFLDALPAGAGMAFILVQHLDPAHESLMVSLLAAHTSMTVRQAEEGMAIEPDHLYVIPPASYLSVGDGVLRLSPPGARHGMRLPFDFLLHSLAEAYGPRAICVILSGTGADGSLGLKTVRAKGGFVVAQSPEQAGFDGMPRSAIATGAVDLVLPIAEIPAALISYARPSGATGAAPDRLPDIVELLRQKTAHDFTLYKPGTLQRRIERRMAMAAIETSGMGRYLEILRGDADELDQLARDLLIHVTSFFRDPAVFELLAEKVLPDLVGERMSDQPLRVWVAGCSTGEETYSLAILLHEQIAASRRAVKLQIFASDVDPGAIASARMGHYPHSIEAEISPERLARFFSRQEDGYRVTPELRASVVFTVQDVLADPPFSRIDLVSCRNLLIYLRPEAQAKVVALFHFALREGGVLLLGGSETAGNIEGLFDVVAKSERIYRRTGPSRPKDLDVPIGHTYGLRSLIRPPPDPVAARQAALSELCRQRVLDLFAPAAVLINRRNECLYFLGPTDRYLRIASGHPGQDLFAMARDDVRTRLRAAIQQAAQEQVRVVVSGGGPRGKDAAPDFDISAEPLRCEGEDLLLICFIDAPALVPARLTAKGRKAAAGQDPLVAELERELAATRSELQGAIRNLELSSEEQKTINEEALSVSEEYQSTNEELLTSKEELQSLNEELTALNSQLQETLERQRTTFNDLQNVLYSTDVATLFLDAALSIRFFTPATRALFKLIPGDIGRPLADLSLLARDDTLLADARAVLTSHAPLEREIEAESGAWFLRRILPYRTQDQAVAGVVITFVDITERKQAAHALEAARQQADQANLAKSRFLAAASHDLRQPLQTLALLQGLLAKKAKDESVRKLVALLDPTLHTMSGMLNTLLDINQIDAGTIHAKIVDFPIADLLGRLTGEFAYHAQAQGLELRDVPSRLAVRSDPRLLEQMLRNLLSNAMKYTKRGKVLIGCRRRATHLSIEIWDTGIGIDAAELQAIFDEYHQIDNPARERSRGLGLGLSIVQRLADLLDHRVQVRSRPGRGSVFSVDVPFAPAGAIATPVGPRGGDAGTAPHRTGAVLIVEDDPEVRDLLALVLRDEGHRVMTASDGPAALELVARGTIRPDIVLADYNLPDGMDGIEVAARLRADLRREVPVLILTGDISTDALRHIGQQNCVQFNKPVKAVELTQAIQRLLPAVSAAAGPTAGPTAGSTAAEAGAAEPVVYVIDDDARLREGLRRVLEADGRRVEDYGDCESFLAAYRPGRDACLLVDAYLPGMSGLELLQRLRRGGDRMPAIMITGDSDVPMAVQAMKAGASDFIEKPIGADDLLAALGRALDQTRDTRSRQAARDEAARSLADLTPRQREIMERVLAGEPNKLIAAALGLSQRTVENHRAAIMRKTGVASLPALVRLALAAAPAEAGSPPEPGTD